MTPADPDLELIERLCDDAGAAILPWFRADTLSAADKDEGGGRFDPVTEADRAAESAIRARLAAERPGDAILGEEFGGVLARAGRQWVIDPIDGTRAFLSGLLHWGVLIALAEGGRPVLGAMDQPYVGERFLGLAGRAWLRKGPAVRPLATRKGVALERAVMLTTDPANCDRTGDREAYDRLASRLRLARVGADCYGFAMVAAGQADLAIETGLAPYDIQAMIPIVEGAGGVVTDWAGGSAAAGGRVLAAGCPRLHAEALALLAG